MKRSELQGRLMLTPVRLAQARGASHLALSPVPMRSHVSWNSDRSDKMGASLTDHKVELVRPLAIKPFHGQVDERVRRIAMLPKLRIT